jgi:type IV pilus assembly protein PilP
MRLRMSAIVLTCALATPTLAQVPAETAPAEAAPAQPAAEEETQAQEAPPLDKLRERTDGYAYNPQGRRDPFISLNRRIEGGERGVRPEGIEGFLIQELALKGVVKTPEGYISMLEGPDARSYFVRIGQKVYDGVVIAMDGSSVTFRQDVTDPLSPVRTREMRKDLYPSEEATQ